MSHELIRLRPYQREAIDAVKKAWVEGMRRPAVVLSTGAGKTVIMSHLIAEDFAATGQRAMVLVNRDELCDQTLDKLRRTAPHIRCGKVKAADDDTDADVVVASVQTLSRDSRLDRMLASHRRRPVGLIVVDEVHFAVAATYRKVLGAFPDARFLGVTATLARGDGVGLGSVVDDVVYSRSILWMMSRGYLVDVRSLRIDTELDLSTVKRSRGDYQAGELGAAMMEAGVPLQVARSVREHAADRRSLVFTPTVATAHATARELAAVGIPAGVVDGTTPREERLRVYADFASGRLRAMVNCLVLTTGFDMPQVDCVVVARPTSSDPLFIQMAGRGLRPFPGKKDCLLLNVAGGGGKISTLIDLADGEPMPGGGARDGESLTEAAERAEMEAAAELAARQNLENLRPATFRLQARAVDLFGGSDQTWLRTNGGAMFVPAGENGQVVLWPSRQESEDGQRLWDVVHVPKERGTAWERLHEGQTLGTAMAWAETEADDFSGFNVRTGAAWRKKRASQGQLDLARRLGLVVSEDTRAGTVGDMLSVAFASRVIDRFLASAPGAEKASAS